MIHSASPQRRGYGLRGACVLSQALGSAVDNDVGRTSLPNRWNILSTLKFTQIQRGSHHWHSSNALILLLFKLDRPGQVIICSIPKYLCPFTYLFHFWLPRSVCHFCTTEPRWAVKMLRAFGFTCLLKMLTTWLQTDCDSLTHLPSSYSAHLPASAWSGYQRHMQQSLPDCR